MTRASHLVADEALLNRLNESDNSPVAFVIGGPGTGKTTTSQAALAEGNIVFDGSAVHAETLLDQAILWS